MKTSFKKSMEKLSVAAIAITLLLSSCNKGFEPVPSTPISTGQNLAERLNTDPNYSIFRDAMVKYGLMARLSAPGSTNTVLLLDNATMTAVLSGFGLTPASFVALPAAPSPSVFASLAAVFTYHVIPQSVPGANIPNSFGAATSLYPAGIPNAQLPSSLQIGTTSGLPVMMNSFLGKNGANTFANTIPVAQADIITASNGVAHRVVGPVIPPSVFLRQLIDTATNLTYLKAAITRADSGQTVGTTAQLDFVLGFAPANLTVFAPTNTAFQTLLTGAIAQALIAQGVAPATALAQATTLASSPAVFSNPALFPVLTAQTVRGIVVYHLLGNRTFSVNLPLATANIRTLLNSAVAAHPGITVDRSTATPRLLGLANGAGNFANFTALDRHGINGVLHVIDRVLLPQ